MKKKGFSLYGLADCRIRTDRELIAELSSSPDAVAEEWEASYSMERLYNRLTPAKKRVAAAAVELYKRRHAGLDRSQAIRCSGDIDRIMRPLIADLEMEEFWLLPMSLSHELIRPVRVSVGSYDCTLVDVRLVMRRVLESGGLSFAVAHNHPSGKLLPSRCDDLLTEQIGKAADFFRIRLLDHLIIGRKGYYSYSDERRLKAPGTVLAAVEEEGGER